jgi:hypothetical protein
MRLTGIIEAHEYRNRILEGREALRQQLVGRGPSHGAPAPLADASAPVLAKISSQLDEIAALLRERR